MRSELLNVPNLLSLTMYQDAAIVDSACLALSRVANAASKYELTRCKQKDSHGLPSSRQNSACSSDTPNLIWPLRCG